MKKAQFLTPVVTIFDEQRNLDKKGNEAVYDHLIKGGIDGIIVMGSSGEFFAMPMEQKKELIDIAVKHVNHRTKIFAGTGCMNINETIELSNYAYSAGADAVMIVGPYYFGLSPENVEYYYDKIASLIKADIYFYNFPDRTGHDIPPDVVLRLLRKHKNFVGYKDTVGHLSHTRSLIETVSEEFPDFAILSGFDENLAHVLLAGGNGCIGGLSNVAPEIFSAWCKAINTGDLDGIVKYQRICDKLMGLYDINDLFIPVLKRAMMMRGLPIQDYCSEPFPQVTEEDAEKIKQILAKTKLI